MERVTRNLASEPFRAEIKAVMLLADRGIGEVDLDLCAEASRIGSQFAARIAHRDPHRFHHLDEAARRQLCNNAGLVNSGDERGGAAIHDRHFWAVDFNAGVINAHAPQSGKHMLGRGDERALAITQHGCEFGRDN